jgi:preprotein translocase subunit SecA
VKQVLRNREKLDEVAKYVVQMGYCANDTIIQTKSDTLITYDTIIEKGADILRDIYHTDTLRLPLTKKIVKTITIRDTIKSVVVDNARIRLLEAKLAVQTEKTEEYKAKANNRLKWLILLIVAISIRLLYKPLLKLIAWHS